MDRPTGRSWLRQGSLSLFEAPAAEIARGPVPAPAPAALPPGPRFAAPTVQPAPPITRPQPPTAPLPPTTQTVAPPPTRPVAAPPPTQPAAEPPLMPQIQPEASQQAPPPTQTAPPTHQPETSPPTPPPASLARAEPEPPKTLAATPPQSPKAKTPRSPTPPQSPKVKHSSKPTTPVRSPKIKPSPPPPPPSRRQLFPPEPKPHTKQEIKPDPEVEQKTVVSQEQKERRKVSGTETIEGLPNKNGSRNGGTKPMSGKGPREDVKDQVGNHKPKGHEDELGWRVITMAGENKGASMKLGSGLQMHDKGHHGLHRNDHDTHNSSTNDGHSSGGEGKPKMQNARPPVTAFVNSNVQSVNNSILFNASCAHKSPGVHMAVTRIPHPALRKPAYVMRVEDAEHTHHSCS